MRQRLLNLIIFFYNSGFYDSFSWLRLLGAETYLGILSPTLLQEKAKRPNFVQKIITTLRSLLNKLARLTPNLGVKRASLFNRDVPESKV